MIGKQLAIALLTFVVVGIGNSFHAYADTASSTHVKAKTVTQTKQAKKHVAAKPQVTDESKSASYQSAGTGVLAPELDGGIGWLNSDKPVHLKDLRGKVVLLDFWTFCCINCMHVIPDLKKLEAKYGDELVVIGVHSAKFDNERDTDNIRRAILRYGIQHPVVNDAKFAIWNAYGVNSWPTIVVIDPSGHIYGQAAGEGNFTALDAAIASIITSFDKKGMLNRKALNLSSAKDKDTKSPLSFPGKIIADPASSRLFISDSGHNRIVITNTDGKVIDIVGSGAEGSADGDFAHSSFHHPQGLAFSNLALSNLPLTNLAITNATIGNVPAGNLPVKNSTIGNAPKSTLAASDTAKVELPVSGDELYVADTENHLIRLVNLKTKQVSTLAGTRLQAHYPPSGGDAEIASLNSPWDLVLVGRKLYMAMAGCHQLWVYDFDKGSSEPYAGNTVEGITDGPLALAALAQPSGITSDGKKLYFVDSEASAVRSADLKANGDVETIVGQGLFVFGDKDGIGRQARLQHPLGITYSNGKLYVADSYNHKIKIVDPIDKLVTTLAGSGHPGFENGMSASFSEPAGLCVLADTLYIADTNNNAIRRLNLQSKTVDTFQIKALTAP